VITIWRGGSGGRVGCNLVVRAATGSGPAADAAAALLARAFLTPALPDKPTVRSVSEVHEQMGMSGEDPHDIALPEHLLIGMVGRRRLMRREPDADLDSLPQRRERTRTPQKRECAGQRLGHSSVEVLAAYSHSAQSR
jgi:hypothetical protein